MTQNANILSFNEVKARGASAPRTVSSKRTSRARHAYQVDSSFSRSGANLRGSGGHAYQSSRFASDDFTSGYCLPTIAVLIPGFAVLLQRIFAMRQ